MPRLPIILLCEAVNHSESRRWCLSDEDDHSQANSTPWWSLKINSITAIYTCKWGTRRRGDRWANGVSGDAGRRKGSEWQRSRGFVPKFAEIIKTYRIQPSPKITENHFPFCPTAGCLTLCEARNAHHQPKSFSRLRKTSNPFENDRVKDDPCWLLSSSLAVESIPRCFYFTK